MGTNIISGSSKSKYQQALELEDIGLWEENFKDTSLTFSRKASEIIGVKTKTKELTYDELLKLIHNDDREKFTTTFYNSRKGMTIDFEVRLGSQRPSQRIIAIKSKPQYEYGTLVGQVGIVKDVTDYQLNSVREMERKMQENEQRYRSLLNFNKDGICAYDLEGNFIEVNQKFGELFGYKSNELIGNHFSYILFEDDLDSGREIFELAFKEKFQKDREYVFKHKQEYKIHISFTVAPIVVDEEVKGVYCIARDITSQKKVESEIKKLSKLNELILQSVSEGIYTIDRECRTLFWNQSAERILGYTKADVLGKHNHDIIHHTSSDGSHYPSNKCPIFGAVHNGQTCYVSDDIFWKKDGTVIPVEYTSNPIIENGEIVGAVVTFRDLTDKRETEEMLRKSEKLQAVGQLAAAIGHEVRNPLTSIKGFIQLLESTFTKQQKAYIKIVKSEMERIEAISSELLILSKPQATFFQAKNPKDMLDSVITLLTAQANMSNVEIVQNIYDVPNIYCDEIQIKQVFVNLIKNGIESMESGGKLTLNLEKRNGEIIIQVKDQGRGIPKEFLSRIGEPFYTTKEKGTGLGILVTNRIVENHKGNIMYESEEGKGTNVTLTLPLIMSN